MDSKVTVSVRSLMVTGLVLLGLAVAYLLGSAGRGVEPAVAAEEPADSPRSLVMRGTGDATVVPDQASFGVQVTARDADLEVALQDANRTMRAVLDALRKHGVQDADVQTTGLSMNPEHHYPNNAAPVLTGYRVQEKARVRVTELGKVGKAITAAVAAGGNSVRVGDIRLEIGDPDAVVKEARDAAVAEARAKAEQYAAATGQSLGAVASLKEVGETPTGRDAYFESRYALRDLAAASAVPIEAGERELKVIVEVVWRLAD